MTREISPEELGAIFDVSPSPVRNVSTVEDITQEQALKDLFAFAAGHELDTRGAADPIAFKNESTPPVPVRVDFAIQRHIKNKQHPAQQATSSLRIVWQPGETIKIPRSFAGAVHRVVRQPGAAAVCMGGAAPTLLVRTDPPPDYTIHPSLLRNEKAESAAVTPRRYSNE